jgi:hypothetical protein
MVTAEAVHDGERQAAPTGHGCVYQARAPPLEGTKDTPP